MSTVKVPGKIIQSGYGWTMRLVLTVGADAFPQNATFTAQVRRAPDVDDVLHTMTTANGDITRVNENTLDLSLPGEATAGWPSRKAFIDVVRTDVAPPVHLGFRLIVPVQQPITRV